MQHTSYVRLSVRFSLLGALASALLLAPRVAQAQSFGAVTWVPLTRGGTTVTDGTGGTGSTDVVGSVASPAAFVASDASFLYARVRVNTQPSIQSQSAFWGCMVDVDGVLTTVENMIAVNGAANATEWRFNAALNVAPNASNETVEVVVGSASGSTNAQTFSVATGFGGNDDWLVDMAAPWSTIRAGGNGAPVIVQGTPFRFLCGTGATASLDLDPAGGDGTLSGSWSDPLVCLDSGCALDADADGVPDTVEAALGTNPASADSDGDGLKDNLELSSGAGPYGPYTGPDSDGDGTRDALDTDSDGDGLTDASEGRGDPDGDGIPAYRDPDDDGDGISTKQEIEDTVAAGVSDDVDGDGAKNWRDRDADGDGKDDAFEGRADADGDGIPNYLDPSDGMSMQDAGEPDAQPAPFDAGPPIPDAPVDAGAPPPPPDDATLSGTGLFCASRPGDASAASWALLGAVGVAALARVRRRRR